MHMFRRFGLPLTVLLMSASSDESGGGAGGGGGSGGGDPPKPITLDDVNKAINSAITARDKRFETKLTEAFGTFGKSIEEKLSALAPKPPEGDGEQQGTKGKSVDPDAVKTKHELATIRKELEAERKKREDAETKQRNQRALGELQSALAKAGVRPEAMDTLTKAFRADITFDDDGNPVLPVDGDAASIEVAIKAWSATDNAKLFLPAPNSGGSGTQRGTTSAAGSQSWKGKPRGQWTDADRDAYASHRAQENAKNPA